MPYDSTKPYKKEIQSLIQQTWDTPYLDIKKGIYATFEKKFSYPEIDHTDGIGTKGIYHWQKRTFREAVQDALAMNLNDLALVGAKAYKLQNHITLPEDDHEAILEIIGALATECKKRNIAITGGETSIHDNADGIDISITVSGFIEKPFENSFRVGDALIGLKSNGLHSNGFTTARRVFGEVYRSEFVEPTRIYYDELINFYNNPDIHGMMHITGGAYTKLKDVLDGADAVIYKNHKLQPQKIFQDLYEKNISDEKMYKTFNCGTGFILSVAPQDADRIAGHIDGSIIGTVSEGSGVVKITSAFSGKEITL